MKFKIFVILPLLIASYLLEQSEIIEKDISIKNGKIDLPGTLTYTEKSKDLIIWIHGSGNVDRNGNQANIVRANYIKQFRDSINKNDIAFFSYDKRTSNLKNAAYLKGITFDDIISDAKKVIEHFKKENQFKTITLVGHSQGSLVAMLASENADKYVSLAGLSETVDAAIIRQVTNQSEQFGKITANHFKELKETGAIKEVNPNLLTIFSKANFPFLKNYMEYNPLKEIEKLTIPTLIINGTKDIQVPVENAKDLQLANSNSKLVIIEKMNHVLKMIEKDSENLSSYYSPDFKLSTELISTITKFVKK